MPNQTFVIPREKFFDIRYFLKNGLKNESVGVEVVKKEKYNPSMTILVETKTQKQMEYIEGFIAGIIWKFEGMSRHDLLFKNVIDGLREFYPILATDAMVKLLKLASHEVNTGNDQQDYETLKEEIEGWIVKKKL